MVRQVVFSCMVSLVLPHDGSGEPKHVGENNMNDKILKLSPSVIHWMYVCSYVMHGIWKILKYSHLFIF